MVSDPDAIYQQLVDNGEVELNRSWPRIVFLIVSGVIVIGIFTFFGFQLMDRDPNTIWRFAPFLGVILVGIPMLWRFKDLFRGGLRLTRDGVQVGNEQIVRWNDVIRVNVFETKPGRVGSIASVSLTLGPGDPRKKVSIPKNLSLDSPKVGPLLQRCLASHRSGRWGQ